MCMTNFQQKIVNDLLVIFFSFRQYSKKNVFEFFEIFRGELQTEQVVATKIRMNIKIIFLLVVLYVCCFFVDTEIYEL